jgi:hypothetical protein
MFIFKRRWMLVASTALVFVAFQNFGESNIFEANSGTLPEGFIIATQSSGIVEAGPARQREVFSAISRSPFRSMRITPVMSQNPADVEQDVLQTADVMEKLYGRGIDNFIVQVKPTDSDYDDVSPRVIKNGVCDSRGVLPWSKINESKYRQRLRILFQELKKRGIHVKAVEVGNEWNIACYNADVPAKSKSTPPTADEIKHVVDAYAKILAAATTVIHREDCYPHAKVISGGLSNAGTHYNGHNMLHTGKLLGALRSYPYRDGKTLFDVIDGIGLHHHPENVDEQIDSIVNTIDKINKDAGSPNKPFWITEWTNGARDKSGGDNLYLAFRRHLEKTLSAPVKVEMISVVLDTNEKMHNLVDLETYRFYPDISFFWNKIGGVRPRLLMSKVAVKNGLELQWDATDVRAGTCYVGKRVGQTESLVVQSDSGKMVVPSGNYTLVCQKMRPREERVAIIEKSFDLALSP